MINYILYDRETGEIVRASQSSKVSNPDGYAVMETNELMVGVDATHRVDVERGEIVSLSEQEARKRKGKRQH